jgi:hypothetical protein
MKPDLLRKQSPGRWVVVKTCGKFWAGIFCKISQDYKDLFPSENDTKDFVTCSVFDPKYGETAVVNQHQIVAFLNQVEIPSTEKWEI